MAKIEKSKQTKQTKQSKSAKLYCYVDETGQDTKGKLFIVAVILLESEVEHINDLLKVIEVKSHKNVKKWQKTRHVERVNYILNAIKISELFGKIYSCVYIDRGINYLNKVQNAIYQAVQTNFDISGTTINVVVDALNKSEILKTGVVLRRYGLKIDKVRGKRDESSPLLRLADAMAGFIRDALEGDVELNKILSAALRKNIIKKKTVSSANEGRGHRPFI